MSDIQVSNLTQSVVELAPRMTLAVDGFTALTNELKMEMDTAFESTDLVTKAASVSKIKDVLLPRMDLVLAGMQATASQCTHLAAQMPSGSTAGTTGAVGTTDAGTGTVGTPGSAADEVPTDPSTSPTETIAQDTGIVGNTKDDVVAPQKPAEDGEGQPKQDEPQP